MNSAYMWFLLIVILILLSFKLIQMHRKPLKEREPSKENWKLIIKCSLIVGLCFGLLFYLEDIIKADITLFLFVGLVLVLVVSALAVGKKVAFRRFFHAAAIGIIGSSLGVVIGVFLTIYLAPPDAPTDHGQGVAFSSIIFWAFGFLSSFFMGCLAILAGKSYDKNRGVHPPGQG